MQGLTLGNRHSGHSPGSSGGVIQPGPTGGGFGAGGSAGFSPTPEVPIEGESLLVKKNERYVIMKIAGCRGSP